MSNIIDYVKWRGDIELSYDGFNEIDNVILSRLSYFDLSKCFDKYEDEVLLDEAYRKYSKLSPQEKNILWKDDDELFPLMAISKRYQNLKITRFINNIDIEKQEQFSAVTILMPDNSIFVSYRGTDNTIVGWKEDFNLSFLDDVPAQLESIEYLKEVAGVYKDKKIRLGGHSKGGNLAIYAASFSKGLEKRIIEVYNNDGPGLSGEATTREGYQSALKKIHTFIPQSSVVGRLLSHEEKYTVVKSVQTGIMQHDVFSWQVERNELIHLGEVDNGSEIVDKTLKKWLKEVEPKERELFIDTLFGLLADTEGTTIGDLRRNWVNNAKIVINNYKNIDEETKKNLNRAIKILWNSLKESITK